MEIRPLSLEEYNAFLEEKYYTPFQSGDMYHRLETGHKNPQIFGGFVDGKLEIAAIAGFYPFKKFFRYAYIPYGPVSNRIGDTRLFADFMESLARSLRFSNVLAIKTDPCIELMEMDSHGNPLPDGFDNHDWRTRLEAMGFIVPPLTYTVDTSVNPRQVAIIDLAKLQDFPGYPTEITSVAAYHTPEDQLEKMKKRTQRYIRTGRPSWVHIEEGNIDQLLNMGGMSGESRHFEFTARQTLEELQEGFQENCRIRHCYIDIPEYRQDIQTQLDAAREELKAMENKKVKKAKIRLEETIASLEAKLAEMADVKEDKLSLACGMFLLAPKETFFLFSGMDRRYRKYQGETWLNWEQMQDSLDRKVWRYNMLGIAGDYNKNNANEGLISYKRDLGARIAEYTGTVFYPVHKTLGKWLADQQSA